jgi:hypothetical protein
LAAANGWTWMTCASVLEEEEGLGMAGSALQCTALWQATYNLSL